MIAKCPPRKEKKIHQIFVFYSIVFLLFFLDLFLFFLFETQSVYSLLCFYIGALSKSPSITQVIIVNLILCLNSLIYHGRLGLESLYLIPITIIGLKISHSCYDSPWPYFILLIMSLLLQIGLIEHTILHLPVSLSYTISTVCVNIGVMGIIMEIHKRYLK